jgi:F0F1-type ATP synthase membrane subunit b/b'
MQAARKTAEDVAAEMIETANQIKNQMFKTANKKLENSSRKLSTICSLS